MWKKLFKKSPPPQTEPINPSLNFEIQSDGRVVINANWQKPVNEQELFSIVNRYVGLIILLKKGTLLPVMQHAVSLHGNEIDDEGTAKTILLTIYNTLYHKDGEENEPVVSPTEAFNGKPKET